jgi:PTH2 family peptidyl-tRNA hydrolase
VREVTDRVAKQVIVMRKDLGMRKGKMIAQGAHAAMAVLLEHARASETELASPALPGEAAPYGGAGSIVIPLDPPAHQWLVSGRFTKVCVSVDSEAALDDVVARAKVAGVPCVLITDAGKTEFHGVATKTCCAVGPAWAEDVDAITGSLPLL